MSGAEVLDHLVSAGGAVWRASWQASVLAALVVAVQLIFGKRIGARWRHAMWMLVLVRLALPVVPSSPLSVFNLAPKAAAPAPQPVPIAFVADVTIAATPVDVYETVGAPVPPLASRIDDRSSAKPQAAILGWRLTDLWAGWPQVLAALWALGAALLGLRVAWATWRVSRTLRTLDVVDNAAVHEVLRATAAELGVRRVPLLLAGEGQFSPALVGCVRPKLLVPRDLLAGQFDARELRLIFLHELAHLKRRDVAINWAATLLMILHWPNPIAWLVMWRLRLERELACDELVMSATSDTDRRAYGHTIVKLLETFSRGGGVETRQPLAGGVGILEGKAQMKRRIVMIAQFARSSRAWTVAAAAIVLALGLVALTDAVQAEDRPAPQPAIAPSIPQPAVAKRTVLLSDGTLEHLAEYDYVAGPKTGVEIPSALIDLLGRATPPTDAEIDAVIKDAEQKIRDQHATVDARGHVLNASQMQDMVDARQKELTDALPKLRQALRPANQQDAGSVDHKMVAATAHLDALLAKRATKLQTLGPKHPEVVALQRNIDAIQKHIAGQRQPSTRPTKLKDGDLGAVSTVKQPSDAEIAQADPTMRAYLRQLQDLEYERVRAGESVGEKHPSVAALDADIKQTRQFIASYGEQFRKQKRQPTGAPIQNLLAQLNTLMAQRALMQQTRGENHPDVAEIQRAIDDVLTRITDGVKLLNAAPASPTNEQIAQRDATMRSYVDELAALRAQLEAEQRQLGPQHPHVAGRKAQITATEATIALRGEEYRAAMSRPTELKAGDLVTVSIMDLVAQGVETVKTARVDGDGTINLPYVGGVKAAGLSPRELEKAVAKAYLDHHVIQNAVVAVSMPERGESHQMAKMREAQAAPPAAAPIVPGGFADPAMMGMEDSPMAAAPVPEDPAAKALLGRKLPELKLDNIPFTDVIDFLRDTTDTNIFVNWRALEAAGIDRSVGVNMRLKDVSLKDAVALVLRDVDGGQTGLTYKVENGVLVVDVAQPKARPAKVTTKAYDVDGMLGGGSADERKRAIAELQQVVMTSVKPHLHNDGSFVISAFDERLIITTSDDVHRDVEQILKLLERSGGAKATTQGTQQPVFKY